MDTTNKAKVLVVGAGPTGLTMAAELTRHGVPCRIIDKKAEITDKTKALTLQSRTMEVFEDMGLIQEVLEDWSSCHWIQFLHRRETNCPRFIG